LDSLARNVRELQPLVRLLHWWFQSGGTQPALQSRLQRKWSTGQISRRGDAYLRMLLTHGARSVIHAATMKKRAGYPLDPLRTWALNLEARTHRNKAVCALANKLARICYAALRDGVPYGTAHIERKLEHTPFKRAG
jgi:hypothetical protein